MLVTNHVLAGAVLGALVRRPSLAFPAGVVSHFALDACRHWGTHSERTFLRVAVTDGLTGLAAMALLARATPAPARLAVVAGMVGGAFPDLDKPSELFFGVDPFPASVGRFHKRIQRESPTRLPQEALVAAGLALVFDRVRRRL